MQFIVMSGHPCDGFKFWGPFDSEEDAERFKEREDSCAEAWVLPLTPPERD